MGAESGKNPGKSLENRGIGIAHGSNPPCRESVTKRPLAASGDHSGATQNATRDPDLTMVIGVWERLPKNIRKAIVAMVEAFR